MADDDVDDMIEALVRRAQVERWPFERLVAAILELPEPQRSRARDATVEAIRDELARRLPKRRGPVRFNRA